MPQDLLFGMNQRKAGVRFISQLEFSNKYSKCWWLSDNPEFWPISVAYIGTK